MSEFLIYCKLGIGHILDIEGIDHLLFIVTLCAVYKWEEYKKLALLVTAFTLGHCFTLALSSMNIIEVNGALIEVLIPITIIVTATFNIVILKNKKNTPLLSFNYILALGFGLVHGMGFSNFFSAMMMGQENIIFPLFSFNLGIEIGQLTIVAGLLTVLFLFSLNSKFKHRYWNMALSLFGGCAAFILLLPKFL
jgi:hypothetical protein